MDVFKGHYPADHFKVPYKISLLVRATIDGCCTGNPEPIVGDTGSQVPFSLWLPEFPGSITSRHGEENTRKPLDIDPWP